MRVGFVALILVLPLTAMGEVQFDQCFDRAGQRYAVSPTLLRAIAKVESNLDPQAYVTLKRSESRGLMQINSFWYPVLATYGIHADDLWDPCTNIHVGAWILAQEIARYGNTWTAVGAYYAGAYTASTQARKQAHYLVYARRVYKKLYPEIELVQE